MKKPNNRRDARKQVRLRRRAAKQARPRRAREAKKGRTGIAELKPLVAATEGERILAALADTLNAATVLKDEGDDDLPGRAGDFVLVRSDGSFFPWSTQMMAELLHKAGSDPPRVILQMRAFLRSRGGEYRAATPRSWAQRPQRTHS